MRIYNSYNLPYLAEPGSDLFAAARLDTFSKLKEELYSRLRKGEDQELILQDLERKFQASSLKHLDPQWTLSSVHAEEILL